MDKAKWKENAGEVGTESRRNRTESLRRDERARSGKIRTNIRGAVNTELKV